MHMCVPSDGLATCVQGISYVYLDRHQQAPATLLMHKAGKMLNGWIDGNKIASQPDYDDKTILSQTNALNALNALFSV